MMPLRTEARAEHADITCLYRCRVAQCSWPSPGGMLSQLTAIQLTSAPPWGFEEGGQLCPLRRNTSTTFNFGDGSHDYRLIILHLASFTYPVLGEVIIPLNVCSFTEF